jgi:hypothetical protein
MPALAGPFDARGRHGVEDSLERLGTRTFVTALGWVLICFTGLAVLSTLLQTFVFTVMFAMPDARPQAGSGVGSHGSDAFRMFLGLLLGFSVLTLASAVAFLKRKNWARRTFVMLFGVAILFNVVALALLVMGAGSTMATTFGVGSRGGSDGMARLILIPTGVAAVGCSLLLGWLIRRLSSAAVRAEFQDREAF